MSEVPDAVRVTPADARLPAAVWTLVVAAFLVAVGFGLIAPVLPLLGRSFGVGVTATSILIGAFAVVRVVFAPLSGRLVARWGERSTLVVGLLVVGASSAACASAADFGQLLAFRAAGGIGSTFFTVASDLLLIRLSPRAALGRASATWSGGFLLGGVGGPAIGAALSLGGLRAPFLVYAGLLVVTALVVIVGLAPPAGPEGQRRTATATSSITFSAACRTRAFRAALLGNLLEGWTVHGMRLVLVPIVVAETFARSATWSGVALTAFAVGTVAALPVGGRLADRRGRRPPAVLGAAVLATTALGLATGPPLVVFLLVSAVSGVGTGLITPALNAAVGDLVAEAIPHGRAGSALAGYQVTGDLGAVVGPVLVGVMADLGGPAVAFGATALLAGLCVVSWLRVSEGAPVTNPVLEVRLLDRAAWSLLRETRLRALRDSPAAFTSTHSQEAGLDEAEWRRSFDDMVWVVAVGRDGPVGMAGLEADVPPDAPRHVQSIWVAPSHRERGVFTAILERVVEIVREDAREHLYIWVVDGNDLARTVYAKVGFTDTEERQPLGAPNGRYEARLRLTIDP